MKEKYVNIYMKMSQQKIVLYMILIQVYLQIMEIAMINTLLEMEKCV